MLRQTKLSVTSKLFKVVSYTILRMLSNAKDAASCILFHQYKHH